MIQRALMAQGYEVIVAQDGDQALRFFDERMHGFDAVLLDLNLPGTNGKSILDELRARDPGILVLLTSGYSATSATKDIEIGNQTRYIQKPFSLKELQDSMNSLLATQLAS
jgi:DNA-binding response OmpR family regulator